MPKSKTIRRSSAYTETRRPFTLISHHPGWVTAFLLGLSAVLCVANFRAAPNSSEPQTQPLRIPTLGPAIPPLPATSLTVSNTNDSGSGSLRQAIADAQDGDSILFAQSLNNHTIDLTTAQLLVNKSVTITGPGAAFLSVARNQQAPTFRIFFIAAGRTVTISGLGITGGSLTSENGAGVYNDHANLTITNCVISGNGTSAWGTGGFLGGAGIYNNSGTLTLTNSSVVGNSAIGGWGAGGGGILATTGGTVIIAQSSINGNQGDILGGGIHNMGMLTISESTVNDNHTMGVGHGNGNGGGIYSQGTLVLQNCIVNNNSGFGDGTGGNGGGINNSGSLQVTNSTITNNTSVRGAGIYNWGQITNSTVSGNSANFDGGGLYGSGTISNCTISGNTASHGGGGIYGGGTITNTTISFNRGSSLAGGIYVITPVHLKHSVLKTGNAGANIVNNNTFVSDGYNISNDNGAGLLTAAGDQINTDPMLGPLQNNGGPTLTHALLSGSQAIDTGDPNFTPPPSTDQRGFPRVSNGRIDKGSFEVQAASPTPTATPCIVLYDQSETAGGGGVVSQNFEPVNNSYDAQGADDFVVPAMQNWSVQQVNVNGNYFNGPGPAASVNVTFYFDAANFPGAIVSGGAFNNLSMSDTAGNFTIPLPTSLVLTGGSYWVAVQANIDFNPYGQWAWADRTVNSNSQAVWQNPGGGFATSCGTYGRRGVNCGIDPDAPDQRFQILGCMVPNTPVNITGTVSSCANPVPGPVSDVAFTLSGSAAGMSSSDASGNYLFSIPSGGNYTVTPNKSALAPGTSGINTTDVVAVQRHFLNLGTPLSGCRLTAADVNGDALVNTVDVIAIQRFYLVLPSGTANTGKYQFNPVTRSYSNLVTNQTNQNYDALVLGDVAPPFVGP